jgi:transcriptional regulator with XRE-family HTH domain
MESNEPRFRHVGLSSDGLVVFCEMETGKTYAMPLRALERAEDWNPKAKPQTVGIIHDGYAAVVEFDTGTTIDFPSDFVLHVCEPSYTWYKNKSRAVSGIGRWIRKIRRSRDLTLEALAAKCGIAKPNLSRLENDKVTPTLATLQTVAAAMNVDLALVDVAEQPEYAWTWTRHKFDEWSRGLRWSRVNRSSPAAPVRAKDMVKVFVARWPEHEYAREKLLEHSDIQKFLDPKRRDPDLHEHLLDSERWAREKAAAKAARERAKRGK